MQTTEKKINHSGARLDLYTIYPIFPQCALSQDLTHAAMLTGLVT